MDTILTEVADGVATVTLNRPDRLNAITPEMGLAYNDALRRADADPDVRVVVLTGAGRGFCAGADLSFLNEESAGDGQLTPDEGMRPELALQLRKPVVAAVNGAAAGLGFALALMADVRFVADEAKLLTSFARLGLVAEYGCSWLLPRLVGVGTALDLLLSGRTVTGREAAELGLAQRSLPADEVLPAALDYARAMAAACSPASLAAIKAQVHGDLSRTFPEALRRSEELMVASFASTDVAEGLRAQQERRAPRFAPLPPQG